MRAAPELAREGTNVALQYARWVRGGDATSVDEVLPGEGAIVRSGVDLLAVHRDDDGRVHARRAMCPHLGCVVSWNAFEKTWDCPCHGSRFDRFGELIHGPAQRGLARVDDAGADGFAVRAASAVLDAALRSASMAAALALRALRAIRRGEAGPGAR
ncbi:MAG TPA: Rieske 2Fe-2S domain-containing protein [Candidatus Binatia bacterium]|nr:Rieske 2Fe-2S domain-containing protein [Candidatus Binatia bacterium]